METVAEGIETEEQLRYAREVGFTNVQGFVLARPMPADALLELMAQMRSDGPDMVGLMRQRRLA